MDTITQTDRDAEAAAVTGAALAFARAVAVELGPEWTGSVDYDERDRLLRCRLIRGDALIEWMWAWGASMTLLDRHYIRGVRAVAAGIATITCATTKTAKQVAADIRRRLLPKYEAALQEAAEKKARQEALVVRLQKAANELAEALGAIPASVGPAYSRAHLRRCLPLRAVGLTEVHVEIDGWQMNADIEIRTLPLAVAGKVLAVLKAAADEKAAEFGEQT